MMIALVQETTTFLCISFHENRICTHSEYSAHACYDQSRVITNLTTSILSSVTGSHEFLSFYSVGITTLINMRDFKTNPK